MKPSDENHFTEEQILVAVVDVNDLSPEHRDHLNRCRRCNQALAAAQAQLDHIGVLAAAHTPEPAHPVRIPDQASEVSRPRKWRGGFALATAAVALLLFAWASPLVRDPLRRAGEHTPDAATGHDAKFMAEVTRLVDDPLPDRYRDLIGSDSLAFEEDFMDFIVPRVTGRSPTSSKQPAPGGSPC